MAVDGHTGFLAPAAGGRQQNKNLKIKLNFKDLPKSTTKIYWFVRSFVRY